MIRQQRKRRQQSHHHEQQHYMPVYLHFWQVTKKRLQLAVPRSLRATTTGDRVAGGTTGKIGLRD
jgi:hypothetical protein